MPNRFQTAQHEIAYKFIAARDGEYCLICGKKPPKYRLHIDHADNNPANWDPENLHLLCQPHNIEMRQLSPAEHKKRLAFYSAKNVSERARTHGSARTHVIKEVVDYRQGSIEMQANSFFEIEFREWIMGIIRENGFITKKDAVYAGAEIVGCNPSTTGRYLSKLTSSVGNLQEGKDKTGTMVITFRYAVKIQGNGRSDGHRKGDLSRTVEHRVGDGNA